MRGERRARWRRCERAVARARGGEEWAGCLGRAGASRGLGRWRAGWAAREGRGRSETWAALGRLGLRVWAGILGSFSISFSFLFLTKFEFKYEFEFKPHSNKKMHQHECNTKF